MNYRLRRWLSVALLALIAFAQANVALATCVMDRGTMAQAMTMPDGDPCDDCANSGVDSVSSVCVAHCTEGLPIAGTTPDIVTAPAGEPLRAARVPSFRSPAILAYLPPGNLPRRILLHSFQI